MSSETEQIPTEPLPFSLPHLLSVFLHSNDPLTAAPYADLTRPPSASNPISTRSIAAYCNSLAKYQTDSYFLSLAWIAVAGTDPANGAGVASVKIVDWTPLDGDSVPNGNGNGIVSRAPPDGGNAGVIGVGLDWSNPRDVTMTEEDIIRFMQSKGIGGSPGSKPERTREAIKTMCLTEIRKAVERSWRGQTISPETKAILRPLILHLSRDEMPAVSKLAALSIGRIARFDVGNLLWPELLPYFQETLVALGNSDLSSPGARLLLQRTLYALKATFKGLCSNQLLKGKRVLEEESPKLFGPVFQIMESSRGRLNDENLLFNGVGSDMELSLLAFKVLVRLITYGWKDPSSDSIISTFFQSTPEQLTQWIQLRTSVVSALNASQLAASGPMKLLDKQIEAYGKFYFSLNDHNHESFRSFGINPRLIELYWSIVNQAVVQNDVELVTDEPTAVFPQYLVLQALRLIKGLVYEHRAEWSIEDSRGMLSIEQGVEVLKVLVTRLLPLRKSDIEKWMEDPEQWVSEDEGAWEVNIRLCSEKLVMEMISRDNETIPQLLGQMLAEVQSTPATSVDTILRKDGVYCAVGLDVHKMGLIIEFDEWLETLNAEARGADPDQIVLRRRIAWLAGHWLQRQLSESTQSRVYNILTYLISENPSTDLVVRITAAAGLAQCKSMWGFELDALRPHLPPAIERLAQLIVQCETPQVQGNILDALGAVVTQAGKDVLPYAQDLVNLLNNIWHNDAGTNGSGPRQSVLLALIGLIQALNEECTPIGGVVCNIIYQSVHSETLAEQPLEEDAMHLWNAFIQRATTLTPELRALIPKLLSLIQTGKGTVDMAFRILESYCMLDVRCILDAEPLKIIFDAINSQMGQLDSRAVKPAVHALVAIIIAEPRINIYSAVLNSTGLFSGLVKPIFTPTASTSTVSKHLCTLARIATADPQQFCMLIGSTAEKDLQKPSPEVLEELIEAMLERYEEFSSTADRKIIAIGLATLAPAHPIAMRLLPRFLDPWISALAETEEDEDGDADAYQAFSSWESDEDWADEFTPEATRQSDLRNRDVSHSIRLRDYLSHKMQECAMVFANGNGQPPNSDALSAWLRNVVDEIVLDEFEKRLTGQLKG